MGTDAGDGPRRSDGGGSATAAARRSDTEEERQRQRLALQQLRERVHLASVPEQLLCRDALADKLAAAVDGNLLIELIKEAGKADASASTIS